MSLGDQIEANILAAGGWRIGGNLIFLDFNNLGCTWWGDGNACHVHVNTTPNNWKIYANFLCTPCYDKFLSLFPPTRTFLERAQLIARLDGASKKDSCLMHTERPTDFHHQVYKQQACCDDCRRQHKNEAAQLSQCYLLMIHVGLPRELARCIIWYVARV
jgi:hypothetical protein